MTAVYGLWHHTGKPELQPDAARMGRALAIYGPDRTGTWSNDDLVLGTDLFICTPEDRLDRQPVASRDGRFMLVADIRLDNRAELAAELGIAGEEARSMADADFALAAWERWGEGALDKLIGDWALAVWDAWAKTLTLARDFLGNRPLFYRADKDRFAFATMAKGIHALPDVPVAPDLDTMREHLALLPMQGAKSFFAGINRVEPGSLVIAQADGRVEAREWYCWPEHEITAMSDDEAIETFRALFDRAVADRLRSVTAISCTLSGGLDSTAVTAAAAIQLAHQSQRLTAYTHVPMNGVPLDEPRGRFADEWPLAHTLAERYPNIDHLAVDSAGRALGADFDSDFFYNEMPMPNPCNGVWVNDICRTAVRRGSAVLLVGAKGNATISYDGVERLPELLRHGHLATWLREIVAYVRRSGLWQHALAVSLLPFLPRAVNAALRRASGRQVQKLSGYSALRRTIAESDAFRARLTEVGFDPGYRPLARRSEAMHLMLRRMDGGPILKGILGAFGVDRRDPTADRRLVEFCLSLPLHFFLRNGQTKWLYRRAFVERIPRPVLDETRKGYQGADWLERLNRDADGLRTIARASLDNDGAAELIGVESVQSLVESPLPQRATAEVTETYRLKLLRGLANAHFLAKATRRNC